MSKIRIAVGGASARGEFFARILQDTGQADIVAIADPVVGRAHHVIEAKELVGTKAFESIESALAAADCDAVVVASSDAHHADVAVPALQAGKFVLCEKPLDTTLAKCRAIVDADRQAGGKTFVGLNLRYAPLYATVKRLIDRGAVGDVLTIQADEFYSGGRTYFRRWNRLRAFGGGLWITKATHDFDLITWLAGGVAPLEVYAAAAKTYYVPKAGAANRCRDCKLAETCPDKGSPDHPMAKIREDSGGEPGDLCLYNSDSDTFDHGIATIRYDKDILATYTCNVVVGFSDRRIRVSGTKGTIDGNLCSPTVILRKRDPSETEEIPVCGDGGGDDISGGHGGADGNVAASFLRFVRGEVAPKCRPIEAAVSVQIGLAATAASDEHRVVPFSEVAL